MEVNDLNSYRTLWGVTLRGGQVWWLSAAVFFAVTAVIFIILAFTPVGKLLPGHLGFGLRQDYADACARIDSLEAVTQSYGRYVDNITAILTETLPEPVINPVDSTPAPIMADSLPEASEAEKNFVKDFDDDRRYNISVLSPIAADGMIFEPNEPAEGVAAAVYRGTVISITTDSKGLTTVVAQHPNNFISIYSALDEVYVGTGTKLVAGQRIGKAKTPKFTLFHDGNPLDTKLYIP